MKETKKLNGWALAFIIIAAVLFVAAVYMLIATIQYINSYIDYGYSFKDVGGVQTIISAVVPYLFYAAASLGIGIILRQILPAKEKKAAVDPVIEEAVAVEALPEVEEAVEEAEDDFEDLVTEEVEAVEEAVEAVVEEEK